MSGAKEIESALARLPLKELQAVRDLLDDFIEDQLEVSDEFKARIQRAKQEMADGVFPYSQLASGQSAPPFKSIRAISTVTSSNCPPPFRLNNPHRQTKRDAEIWL